MSGRYERLVPKHYRLLIKRHRLPRPNWFVGAAERAPVVRDEELQAEIDKVKTRVRALVGAGAGDPQVAAPDVQTPRRPTS